MPVLQMLRSYFGIHDGDPERIVREKIAGRALLLDPEFADELPVLFDFLGVPDPDRPLPKLSAEARQRALQSVVCHLVRAPNRREPIVTVIEDLHWMDAGSAAMLGELFDAVEGTQTMVVVNFRPEYTPEWTGPPDYHRISLEPLGATDTAELLRDLAGDDPSLDGLGELIHERTAGNPFFIEEIVRALAEAGNLEGERGAYRLARPVEDAGVPASVQTVLAARIDRLEAETKRLLQVASVAGKEFGERTIRLTAGRDAVRDGSTAVRADRRRLPLRNRALPRTRLRLPPPPDPRGRLRHPARRAARDDPRGDGAGSDRAEPRSRRRAGCPDRAPHGGGRGNARGGALVGARGVLDRLQPAPRRAATLAPGDGAGRRARGGRGDDGAGDRLAAASTPVRLAARDGQRGGESA